MIVLAYMLPFLMAASVGAVVVCQRAADNDRQAERAAHRRLLRELHRHEADEC